MASRRLSDVTSQAGAPARSTWDAAAFRAEISQVLTGFVDEQAGHLEPLGADVAPLVTEARRAVDGGKRFRAAFCYWGFRAVSDDVADHDALIRACASLEVLHASALVHDDLMDDSDVRRGRPAAHRAFSDEHAGHGWRGDPRQYGAAAAILLGDMLLAWSDELLRTCGMAHDVVRDALALFDTTRSEVVAGQFLDVAAQARGADDLDLAMRVLRYKSAKYSIERPLHIGAALAGANASMLQALTSFGLPLGEAFQLRDDLLGVFGDPSVTGKPAGDDLIEGKRTVLVALAAHSAPPDEAAELDTALGTPLDERQVERLRRIINDSGAHARVEAMIEEHAGRALDALAAAPLTEAARAVLHDLALAATQRVV